MLREERQVVLAVLDRFASVATEGLWAEERLGKGLDCHFEVVDAAVRRKTLKIHRFSGPLAKRDFPCCCYLK